MVDDREQLVLSISADVRQMKRALDRLIGDSRKTTTSIENHFNSMGSSTEAALARTANAGTRSFGRVQASAAGIGRAMKVSQFQTANLAAQMNDIGVQLAGGQSPLLIAIQQGTQINQVLGRQGARGAVAALGGAFASLINPVSLATIAFIGLGGTALQYFTGVLTDGAQSEEQIKKERDLIRQVAKEWGDALPALKAYADELDRIEKRQDAEKATTAKVEEIWGPVIDEVGLLNAELANSLFMMDSIGESPSLIIDLQRAFDDLKDSIEDGTATGADVVGVIGLLRQSGLPSVQALGNQFAILAQQIDTAARSAAVLKGEIAVIVDPVRQFRDAQRESLANLEKAQQAGAAFATEQQRINSLTAYQLALEAEIARIKKEASDSGAVLTANEAKALAEQRLAAEETRRVSTDSRNDAAKAAEKEREAVMGLIEELGFELELIGLSDEERRTAIELRKAGAAATAEQRNQIVAKVAAIYDENEALAANSELMSTLNGLSKDVLGGFISDMQDGTDAAEALQNALDKVLDKLIDIALNNLFPTSGGGGILSAFGGLLGSGGGGTDPWAGLRGYAGGGISRKPAIFGEAGPEAAVPLPDGRRIPVDLRMPAGPAAGGSMGGRVQIALAPGLEAEILDQAGEQSIQIVHGAAPSIVSAATGQTAKGLARGDMDGIMRGRYGLKPNGIRRG